jgi:hypothetical protein
VSRGRPLAGIGALIAVVALVLGLGAGCSSDDKGSETLPGSTSTLVPSSDGDSCNDPTGDLDLPVGVTAATPGLSGVDLVAASAKVDGDQLVVTMTAAGPIDAAPAATYVVAQGDPLGQFSFELRMAHGTDGWTTTAITWPNQVEARQKLPITPKVDGATLTTSVPLSSLPAISLAMQFGSTATIDGLVVVDDCSSLTGG